jgi:DNA-binding GntR family transcriptional regulator
MQVTKMEPLHHQAYLIIKKMILEGDYQPGERVVELKLAQKLGTSRGPVREAIRMLIQDGLIIQNGGLLTILQIHSQDIRHIFMVRQSLESLSAKLAAAHMTETDLNRLETNIEQARKAVEDGDVDAIIQNDQEFHDIIAQSANNRHLLQLYEVIKTKVIFVRLCIIKNFYKNFINFVDEHQLIYNALKAQDPARSELEMHDHIQKNLEVSYTLYDSKMQ